MGDNQGTDIGADAVSAAENGPGSALAGPGPGDDQQGDDRELRLEAGRLLFAGSCAFLRSAPTVAALPPIGLPELAFAGRSNVGKSSLVNALTGRRTLARTSNTPGRTQALNFFDLGGRLMLVDMPGYGYAKAPKPIVAAWTALLKDYLRGRVSLKRVLLLVDSRRGLMDTDREFMEMMDIAAVPYQGVLTKADKPASREVQRTREAVQKEFDSHPAAHPHLLLTSSAKSTGLAELRAEVADLLDPA